MMLYYQMNVNNIQTLHAICIIYASGRSNQIFSSLMKLASNCVMKKNRKVDFCTLFSLLHFNVFSRENDPKGDLGRELWSPLIFLRLVVEASPKWSVHLAMQGVSSSQQRPVRMGTLILMTYVKRVSHSLHFKNPCNNFLNGPQVACCKVQFLLLSNIPDFFGGSPNSPDLHVRRLYYRTYLLFLLLICSRLDDKQPTIDQ